MREHPFDSTAEENTPDPRSDHFDRVASARDERGRPELDRDDPKSEGENRRRVRFICLTP
ncbi:MAG: hypothetical protein KDB80_11200 [Planctomycetes bacterium]|nr:hypothetical protein [Planctomycetota bacterium]